MSISASIAAVAEPVAAPNGRRLGRRLRDLLKNEARLQHRLLALATDTREAIIEREIEAVVALESEHRETLNEAEAASHERRALSHDIARAYHVPAANVTLTRVLEVLPAEVAIEIGITATLLLEVVRAVRAAHGLNRELLEDELAHIRLSREVVAPVAAPRREYSRRLPAVSAAAMMLDKAA